jgi:hypothetical protein
MAKRTETSAPDGSAGKPRPASRRVAVERPSSRMALRCGRWTRIRADERTLPQFPISRGCIRSAVAEAAPPSRRRRRLSRGRESFPACKALKTHKTRKFSSSPFRRKSGLLRADSAQLRRGRLELANDAGGIAGKHGATDGMRNFPACNALEDQEMRKFSPSSRVVPRRSDGARRG